MNGRSVVMRIAVCLLLMALVLGVSSYAAKENLKYEIHDETRPRPPVITPPERFGEPPSDPDTIILFNGTDLSEWESDKGGDARWTINKEEGYMEVAKKAGGIHTRRKFGNCQLHIEWATPPPKGRGQGRGNSGVFFMGRYELQVLDSYDNPTYADGQAASIYGQHPPLVNVCRKPREWQSYDVSFLRPIFDKDGRCIRPARITVLHNGVVVHNNVEIMGTTAHKRKARYRRHGDQGPISLQDHGNPMRFRNIWIRELPEQPYLIGD